MRKGAQEDPTLTRRDLDVDDGWIGVESVWCGAHLIVWWDDPSRTTAHLKRVAADSSCCQVPEIDAAAAAATRNTSEIPRL
jgi:hypothetical protein